jgi:hypothetical protein
MHGKLTLDLEQLSVESFEATHATPPQGPIADDPAVVTCLQTDCGRFRCCA